MHDDDSVAHDRFDRYGRLESRMDAVEIRQTRLEDAHTEQERAFYGYPDPSSPSGFVPGIIQRMFDAITMATEKLESLEKTAANFASGVKAAAKFGLRLFWTMLCGTIVATGYMIAWLVNHWTAVDKLLNAIGKVMQ